MPADRTPPNTPLQNPNDSHKHVWLTFTVKYPTTRNTVDGLVCLTSVMTVHSGYGSFTCGMFTAAFPPKFRQNRKKRERKVKTQFEQKGLD